MNSKSLSGTLVPSEVIAYIMSGPKALPERYTAKGQDVDVNKTD